MRVLLACEFYYPSRGGVQEVMRQIAERLVAAGHDVTVATTRLPERDFKSHNGVKIEEFAISGNLVNGMNGETQAYVDYLKAFDGDAIMIKAAQQWTFDASWPALDTIKARKIFIPCGFSCLYEPNYKTYFDELPAVLAKFDRLIFYAERYRDVDFARAHGLDKLSFIPNGASDVEFEHKPAPGLRARLGISEDALLIMTVGTPINAKGHTELTRAFGALDPKGRELALILNGQWPKPPPEPEPEPELADAQPDSSSNALPPGTKPRPPSALARILGNASEIWRRDGSSAFLARAMQFALYRAIGVLRSAAAPFYRAWRVAHAASNGAFPAPPPAPRTIDDDIADAEAQPLKRVFKTNLSRSDLIGAFFTADLFVFASNVEYSPLVLFEAGAAGLPYVTVPVGNAEEIVRWTGGGEVCPAAKDERGYTRVAPEQLAMHIQALLDDPARRKALSEAGRASWRRIYNWAAITSQYEAVLSGKGGEFTSEFLSGASRRTHHD